MLEPKLANTRIGDPTLIHPFAFKQIVTSTLHVTHYKISVYLSLSLHRRLHETVYLSNYYLCSINELPYRSCFMKCQRVKHDHYICILLTGSGACAVPDFVCQTAPIFSKSGGAVILGIASPSRQCDWVPRTGRTWI